MEFRRVEIKKVYRHIEAIKDLEDSRNVFQAILQNNLTFCLKAGSVGSVMDDAVVLSVGSDFVEILSRKPLKVKVKVPFDDVEFVEIVSDREIVAEEDDDGGRWARMF